MRDILITLIIVGSVPFIFRHARVGAYMWAWISMNIPHRLCYGFARYLPFAQLIAVVTMLSFLFSRERKPLPINSITVILMVFIGWMSITSLVSINPPDRVLDQWVMVIKIQVMLFITFMLLRGREQIERLIWVVTLSIAFYGIKGGVWTLLTGGGSRVWGPPGGLIEGNNELGVALVMLIPMMYYLINIVRWRWIRLGMIGGTVMMLFAILGTQSRGALLAVVGMAFLLGIKGKRPVLNVAAIVAVLAVAFVFMPDSWSGRMQTVQSYEQDGSAMSRIYTWTTLWNVAVDRPIFGAGFRADSAAVFSQYAPAEFAALMGHGRVLVAHSIYFQALGEHGFPGLFLYIGLGIATWLKAGSLARKVRHDPEYAEWVPLLMRMVQVSIFGFAIGGAFLSLVHFDLPYYIIGYVVLVDATLRETPPKQAAAPAPVQRPPRIVADAAAPAAAPARAQDQVVP